MPSVPFKTPALHAEQQHRELQAGAEFTSPQTEVWHKGSSTEEMSSAASAAQHSARGCETHAARRTGQGQSLRFATETMQLALMVTFCERKGEKLFKLLHQNVTFFFLIVIVGL